MSAAARAPSDTKKTDATGLPALVCIRVLFRILWLPLGHQSFLDAHWMNIGAFLAPTVLFFTFHRPTGANTPAGRMGMLAGVLLSCYLLHQVEEHWIDL